MSICLYISRLRPHALSDCHEILISMYLVQRRSDVNESLSFHFTFKMAAVVGFSQLRARGLIFTEPLDITKCHHKRRVNTSYWFSPQLTFLLYSCRQVELSVDVVLQFFTLRVRHGEVLCVDTYKGAPGVPCAVS